MEFDKNRVYTALNADELHVGDIVICDDTIANLMKKVTAKEVTPYTGIITKILDDSYALRFESTHCMATYFAYLVKRKPESKYVPWTVENFPLKCGDVILYKNNNIQVMVTGTDFSEEVRERVRVRVNGNWLSFHEIFEDYVMADGTPCGTEVNV